MNLITREELHEKLERGDEFKLVMTLPEFSYRAKHIPSSLRYQSVGDALAELDPGEEIVVYCADVHCAASIYAYHLLRRQGYGRVRRYAGGVSDWEDAGYPLESGDHAPAPEPRARRREQPRVGWLLRPWRVCF
jgi:rhodanese-related sulfurtransferase